MKYFDSQNEEQVVTKPFLGFGGRDVELQGREAYRHSASSDLDRFIQPFVSEVRTRGDRRVLFLEGKVIGHFVRMPAQGGFISNLAQGGTAHAKPLSAEEEELCVKVSNFLAAVGINFAGADFIGSRVSEINITSPTGLRSLEALGGSDGSEAIIEAWEKRAFGQSS